MASLGCVGGNGARVAGPESSGAGWRLTSVEAGFDSVATDLPGLGAGDALETLIAPYRQQMEEELEEVLGEALGEFRKDDPEGALDNLVADAVLDEVRESEGDGVDLVLLNDGGLRVPLGRGPVRVRHAYELLPFENAITLLTLTGAQVEALADQVARTGGEPIAGWTMVLVDEDAVNVRIGGEAVDPGSEYVVATVDYLANGGGSWSVLWDPVSRRDLAVLIRDTFMDYVREEGEIEPRLDGRIRMAPGPDGAPFPRDGEWVGWERRLLKRAGSVGP